MMMNKDFFDKLDIMIPEVHCELNYTKDYELLIAVMLSAQSTDKRVNEVTKELFSKYDIYSLAEADINDLEKIIRSVGTFTRKARYLKNIAIRLVNDYNGVVPNNSEYLESLPGIGHKTCNVVLSELYNVPAIAVDTHVSRVSKRLEIANINDDVSKIEKKLMNVIPEEKWGRLHLQLVLFGRYICKAKNPECYKCLFNKTCKSCTLNKEVRNNGLNY